MGKFIPVKANETEKGEAFLDRKESSDMLREISIVSKLSEEPDWESLVKKQMFKWVVLYGGAILLAAGFALLMFALSRSR